MSGQGRRHRVLRDRGRRRRRLRVRGDRCIRPELFRPDREALRVDRGADRDLRRVEHVRGLVQGRDLARGRAALADRAVLPV